MKIDKNKRINNIPIIKIRNFLRRFSRGSSEDLLTHISGHFNLTKQEAPKIIEALVEEGYIEKEGEVYYCTIKGNALSNVRFIKRMNKEKADKEFSEFMKRVENLNQNNEFIYQVKRIVIFGSYLNPENKDFGDIDIGIELEPRIKDKKVFELAENEIISNAIENGKVFSNIIDELFYPQDLVFKYLKNKSRYISIHRMDQVEGLNAIYNQVFPI